MREYINRLLRYYCTQTDIHDTPQLLPGCLPDRLLTAVQPYSELGTLTMCVHVCLIRISVCYVLVNITSPLCNRSFGGISITCERISSGPCVNSRGIEYILSNVLVKPVRVSLLTIRGSSIDVPCRVHTMGILVVYQLMIK